MLCAKSTAQSIKPGLQVQEDSAAIAARFVRNAGPILDSLTALHFARLRINFLEGQVKEREAQRDQLANQLDTCTAATGQQISQRVDDKGELSQVKQKLKSNQVQKLLMGAALVLSIYLHFQR